jgi:diguanylate cyclase (GGDEF)-like protein
MIDKGTRVWLLILLVGIPAVGGYYLLPSTNTQNIFVALIDASVVAMIVAGMLMYKPSHPLPWCLFAFGMVFLAAGDIVWAVYSWGIEYPYPSIADIFYLASIPLFVVGLLLIGRGEMGRNRANLIDPLIVGVCTGMLSWVFLVEPGLYIPSSLLDRLLSITYLFAYVVMLTILIRPLFVPAKRLPSLYLLWGSLAVYVITDLVYGSIISGTYEAYKAGSLVYAGLLVSSVLLGAAALHPSMAPLSEPASETPTELTWWRLALVTGATLTAPGVLAIQVTLDQPVDVPLILGGSAGLFSLVTLRMAGMIRERKALERRLKFRASHDPLTHLPNRTLFTDRFEQALARNQRQGDKVAVLFVDLDNFKEINDSLGHEMGDRVLIAVAHRLRACLRPGDTAARLGGDEFTILLEDVGNVGEALQVAQRILAEMRAPIALGELETVVSASIGISLGDGTHDRPAMLLREADLALYLAKTNGKASYEVFDHG